MHDLQQLALICTSVFIASLLAGGEDQTDSGAISASIGEICGLKGTSENYPEERHPAGLPGGTTARRTGYGNAGAARYFLYRLTSSKMR